MFYSKGDGQPNDEDFIVLDNNNHCKIEYLVFENGLLKHYIDPKADLNQYDINTKVTLHLNIDKRLIHSRYQKPII